MKKLFAEISVLLVVLIAAMGILEFLYRDYKSPVDFILEDFGKNRNKTNGIIIGNSHAEALLTPTITDSVPLINISMGGQDLFHMKILLEYCLPKAAVKYVVFGLDYELLGYNFAQEQQLWKDRYYYRSCGKMYDMSFSNKLLASSNFFLSNRDFNFLFTKQAASKQGFIPPAVSGNRNKQCKDRAEEHSVYKYSKTLEAENYSILTGIIDLCKKNNTRLIFINTPKSRCYAENYNKEVIKNAKSRYEELSKTYNVIYLDLFSSPEFNDDDFLDYDHLNEKGVKKLVVKLKELLAKDNDNE